MNTQAFYAAILFGILALTSILMVNLYFFDDWGVRFSLAAIVSGYICQVANFYDQESRYFWFGRLAYCSWGATVGFAILALWRISASL